MARGTATRGYRGAVGQTRTERVHYTCPGGSVALVEVHRAVNVSTHPELGAKLLTDELNRTQCPGCDQPSPVNVSVVYHDPDDQVLVLVVPDSARHTELAERAELLRQLDADREYEVPRYARDPAVVFGGDELRDFLARRRELDRRSERVAELEAELAKRKALVERDEQAAREQREELQRVAAALEQRSQQLRHASASGADPDGTPLPKPVAHEDIQTSPFELMTDGELEKVGIVNAAAVRAGTAEPVFEAGDDDIAEEEDAPAEPPPPARRRVREFDDTTTSVGGTHDVEIERWIVSGEPTMKLLSDRGVRLAVTAAPEQLEVLLAEPLLIRVQLHTLPTYPLIVLSFARDYTDASPVCFELDVAAKSDRAVLDALTKEFKLSLSIYDSEYLPVKQRVIAAPLAENVRYVVSEADDHLEGIAAHARSLQRAHLAWSDPAYDRFGARHPAARQYRAGGFDDLSTPARVWEALRVAGYFSEPARERDLVLVVGESLVRWQHRRSRIAMRAVELGLWPGGALAQLAIAEGAARSRKDLVQRLRRSFTALVAEAADSDLRDDIIEANWRLLREQAEALGLAAEGEAIVSGTIGGDTTNRVAPTGPPPESVAKPARERDADATPVPIGNGGNGGNGGNDSTVIAAPPSVMELTTPQLVELLDDKDRRREAAIELCVRGDPQGAGPVFQSLNQMTRSEAVQVLGNVVKLGDHATPHLLEGLRSRKGFLRQGSALALAVLKNEVGIEAICDLLLGEPTEIWREIARSVGEVGAGAIMSLVSRLRNQPDAGRERIAWALAHVAARGGRGPIETLSHGRDPIAAGVARHALDLADLARSDDLNVRGPNVPRDQTVNRAFSRKFFEAKERWERAEAMDAMAETSGVMALDDADLLEADAEPLDERDLIPT